MKITEIKTYPIWVGTRNQLVVKVETDEGIAGWGESGLSGREQAVVGAIRHYREWLIGRDPMRIGALWQEMYRSQYFEGGRVLTAAQAALDLAFYDIAGKALGVPVYQLLGGKQRDWIPCFASTTAPMGPQLVEQVKLLASLGWPAIRTGIHPGHGEGEADNIFEPRISIAETATWLAAARAAVGPGPLLGVDYHHRLSVAEAASFCQRMPPGTLDFLEEPIRAETPDAYAALRKLTDVPFAIGEEASSKWAFLPYLEHGITQFARIDVCNVGGLTEAMKVAALAESHYIDLMPHNPLGPICTAATAHFSAAVPNFAWLETRISPTEQLGFHDPDWFPTQLRQDEYRLIVSDAPGLGVEFNEERALRTGFEYWEPPHLRRRDGSVTNW
jgi:galactonate dehydratase